MELNQYPSKIAALSNVVNELEGQISNLKQFASYLELWAIGETAFDPELKNEKQREFKRCQLLHESEEYAEFQNSITEISKQKAAALTELERVRNAFSVAKLEMRLTIVQQLTGSETQDLVGV